jgi:hypothetical protein
MKQKNQNRSESSFPDSIETNVPPKNDDIDSRSVLNSMSINKKNNLKSLKILGYLNDATRPASSPSKIDPKTKHKLKKSQLTMLKMQFKTRNNSLNDDEDDNDDNISTNDGLNKSHDTDNDNDEEYDYIDENLKPIYKEKEDKEIDQKFKPPEPIIKKVFKIEQVDFKTNKNMHPMNITCKLPPTTTTQIDQMNQKSIRPQTSTQSKIDYSKRTKSALISLTNNLPTQSTFNDNIKKSILLKRSKSILNIKNDQKVTTPAKNDNFFNINKLTSNDHLNLMTFKVIFNN